MGRSTQDEVAERERERSEMKGDILEQRNKESKDTSVLDT